MNFEWSYASSRPMSTLKPSHPIVWERKDFGYHVVIEELTEPMLRGASMRTHRVWCNGAPAAGRQYCHDLKSAIENAEYLFQHNYVDRIVYLEKLVSKLHSDLHRLKPITPVTQISRWEDL